MMNNARGFIAMIAATILWGNFVLVFSILRTTNAFDIVAHRVVWAMLFLFIWLGIKGRLNEIITVFKNRREMLLLGAGAIFVSLNWLGFVWAVGHQHALEAGLGYFIFPLISIGLGAVFKGEKLNSTQWIAISLAALAVLILTFGLGKIPWIALFLAGSFALYGFIKSYVASGAVLSVTIENILLLPVAIIWLLFYANHIEAFFAFTQQTFWLITAGLFTAIALILFSYATKTIGLMSVGILFFINPSLQVINAAVILGEPMSKWHQIAFPLIWLGCAIYCWDLWQKRKIVQNDMSHYK